jgi:alpha-glucosidase
MLLCEFKREEFKDKIDFCLADVKRTGSSSTWVFSNHDVNICTADIGIGS